MRERAAVNRRMMVGVAGAILTALLLWVGFHIYKRPGGLTDRGSGGTALPEWAAANVRPATLFECYEHARENVPPRNDTGIRQRGWTAPPMPVELVRGAVNEKSAAEERELLGWIEKWDANYRAGRAGFDPVSRNALEGILERT